MCTVVSHHMLLSSSWHAVVAAVTWHTMVAASVKWGAGLRRCGFIDTVTGAKEQPLWSESDDIPEVCIILFYNEHVHSRCAMPVKHAHEILILE